MFHSKPRELEHSGWGDIHNFYTEDIPPIPPDAWEHYDWQTGPFCTPEPPEPPYVPPASSGLDVNDISGLDLRVWCPDCSYWEIATMVDADWRLTSATCPKPGMTSKRIHPHRPFSFRK